MKLAQTRGAVKLYQITAPHFVAGLEADNYVVKAAPIIKYMHDWAMTRVATYCQSKRWKLDRVDQAQNPTP